MWKTGLVLIWALAMGYIIAMSGHGLDLTDESSYLNWISAPWLYPLSVSQYGFFYHPLYLLLDGDIAALRVANVLFTNALASWLGFVILHASVSGRRHLSPGMAAAACLPFGFTTVLNLANWLVTPNYNSLNLQGILLCSVALVRIGSASASGNSKLSSAANFFLLGIGGWMVFLAKPTSAALLAAVALCYLVSVRRARLGGILLAAAVSGVLVVISAFAIDGSVWGFVTRLAESAGLASAMDDRYTALGVLRLDPFTLAPLQQVVLLGTAGFCVAVIFLLGRGKRIGMMISIIMLLITIVILSLMPLGAFHFVSSGWSDWFAFQIISFPLAAVISVFGGYLLGERSGLPVGQIQLAGLLIALPFVFAMGTNINYWTISARAGVFWIAAALVLMRIHPGWRGAQVTGAGVLLPFAISLTILGIGMEYPYRQTQPLRQNDRIVQIGGQSTGLTLSADFADYTRQLKDTAYAHGYTDGTPLIDLTGHYPAAPLILAGEAVGQAWMIGGYFGSDALAAAAIQRVSCRTLVNSWLLTEPQGPRAISQIVLGLQGLRFEKIGPIASPRGSYEQSYQQYLMRPVHNFENALRLCEMSRQGRDRTTEL